MQRIEIAYFSDRHFWHGGYDKAKKDTYLIVDDADFESARIESSSAIKIDKFVDAGAIDLIYFDASYYVGPDGNAGPDVFVVLRDAIAVTGKMALSRVVIAWRERPIAIMPMGKGLVVHTLHDERDLNDHKDLFERCRAARPISTWSSSRPSSSRARPAATTRPTPRTATRPGCAR